MPALNTIETPKVCARPTYLGTHFQFHHFDFVRDYGRFVALVEGSIEHLDRIVVELV